MSANVQRVPKLLIAVNGWVAAGSITQEQGQSLIGLTLAKNEEFMQLADEIGTTPDSELLEKALALAAAAPSPAAASSSGVAKGRKGRPALNIGTVKDANATEEAARADEVESQADALLKAKRMRNLKRQSMPEKTGLPQSVTDQLE